MTMSIFNTSVYDAFTALATALVSADSTSDVLNSKKADITKKISDENKLNAKTGYSGSVLQTLKRSYHTEYTYEMNVEQKEKKLSIVMYKNVYAHNVLLKVLGDNKALLDEYKMLYKLFLSALSEDISETEEKPSVNQLQKQTQAFVNQLKLGDKFFIQKSDIRYIMNSLILKNGAIRNTYEAKKMNQFDDMFSMLIASKLNNESIRIADKNDREVSAKKLVSAVSVVRSLTAEQVKIASANLYSMEHPEAPKAKKQTPEEKAPHAMKPTKKTAPEKKSAKTEATKKTAPEVKTEATKK